MKQIKPSLSLALFLHTGIAVVLTNAVVLLFWAGDVLQREAGHLRQLLTIAAPLSPSPDLPYPLQSLLGKEPAACLFWNGTYHAGQKEDARCQQGLASLMSNVSPSGLGQSQVADVFLTDPDVRYLRVVVSLPSPTEPALAAVATPLTAVLHSLWKKEQIIALYLLFNALVLTALAFFRLLKRYVLPVDRMVQAAETYSGEGFQASLFERPTDELGQLASSIQGMVRRIEADKEALRTTVRQLAEKNDLLQKNQQEMIRTEKLAAAGRMSAGLAHEIGNPLGVVQGYVQLIGMEDCTEAERIDYAGKALDELQRMDRLVCRLLDHTRARAGDPAPCDVGQLLTHVVQSLGIQSLCAGIRFEVQLEAAEKVLWIQQDTLRQVIVNALLNAVDAVRSRHGQSGGIICLGARILTKESVQDRPNLMIITISDNGIGIPPELIGTVFEPFFTTKEPGKGTGLGLSVSLALIKSMGGRMTLCSEAGHGTRLQILLPMPEDNASEDSMVALLEGRE